MSDAYNSLPSLVASDNLFASYDFNQSSYTALDDVNGYGAGLEGGASYTSDGTRTSNDVIAPTIINLTYQNISESSLDITFDTNEDATIYYVLTASATPPTSQQMVDSQDHTGGAPLGNGTYNSVVAGAQNYSVSTLTPETTYYLYWLAVDASGNRSAIASDSFTTLTPPNNALTFNGTDYVNINSPLGTGDKSYTKEAWINFDGGSGNIISSGPDPLWISSGTLSAGNAGSYNIVNSPSFPISVWKHVAVSYNAGTSEMKLYIDGVEVASAVAGAFSGGTTHIGAHVPNGTVFNGQMDEVRIWDDVRTPAEIAAYYDSELTGNEPNLVDYYQMNDGSGTTVTDLVDEAFGGTSNDGTITGGAVTFNITGPTLGDNPGDVIAPVLSNINIYDVFETSLNVYIDSDEYADIYWVITQSSSTPSTAQILLGQDDQGNPADNFASIDRNGGTQDIGIGSGAQGPNDNALIGDTEYYIYFLAVDVEGNQSNILSSSFTTVAPVVPSDITITTIPVAGGSIAPGSIDNLVYSFQMDVATANAEAQGFQFNLAGTSLDADFEVNGVTLEVSTVSDFSSSVTFLPGTYDPTTNFGGADIQALDATEYIIGTTYYFRLRLNLSGGAIAGNTFNVIMPAEANFFFANGINSFIDGGINPGNTFTIQAPENALAFDGSNDWVSTSIPTNDGAEFTFEGWIRNTADLSDGNNDVILSGDNWWFGIETGTGAPRFNYGNDLIGNFDLRDSQWHHLALVYDNAVANIYVDGIQVTDPITMSGSGVGSLKLGQLANNFFFQGELENVRIWNSARSQTEVITNANVEIITGPVASFSFNESTG
ncbi:MAG: LamG domain-containing protein, partial [Cyclobacteriaceae bacterium]